MKLLKIDSKLIFLITFILLYYFSLLFQLVRVVKVVGSIVLKQTENAYEPLKCKKKIFSMLFLILQAIYS